MQVPGPRGSSQGHERESGCGSRGQVWDVLSWCGGAGSHAERGLDRLTSQCHCQDSGCDRKSQSSVGQRVAQPSARVAVGDPHVDVFLGGGSSGPTGHRPGQAAAFFHQASSGLSSATGWVCVLFPGDSSLSRHTAGAHWICEGMGTGPGRSLPPGGAPHSRAGGWRSESTPDAVVVLLEARLLTPGSLTTCHPAMPASPGVQRASGKRTQRDQDATRQVPEASGTAEMSVRPSGNGPQGPGDSGKMTCLGGWHTGRGVEEKTGSGACAV